MDSNRRNAEQALQINPKIESFINEGLESNSIAPNPKDDSASESKPEKETTIEIKSLKDERSKESRQTKKQRRRRLKPATSKDRDLEKLQREATYSKATVQKTVRFNPDLIVRWEAFVQESRVLGETPDSFQKTQNDALRMWLDSKPSSNKSSV